MKRCFQLKAIPSIRLLRETTLLDSVIISNAKPPKNVRRTLLHKSYFLYFIFKALFLDRICSRVTHIPVRNLDLSSIFSHLIALSIFYPRREFKVVKKESRNFPSFVMEFSASFLLFLACNWNFQLFQHPFFKEFLFCG